MPRKSDKLSSIPGTHSTRREPTPKSCTLTSIHDPWHRCSLTWTHCPPNIHTHTYTYRCTHMCTHTHTKINTLPVRLKALLKGILLAHPFIPLSGSIVPQLDHVTKADSCSCFCHPALLFPCLFFPQLHPCSHLPPGPQGTTLSSDPVPLDPGRWTAFCAAEVYSHTLSLRTEPNSMA